MARSWKPKALIKGVRLDRSLWPPQFPWSQALHPWLLKGNSIVQIERHSYPVAIRQDLAKEGGVFCIF